MPFTIAADRFLTGLPTADHEPGPGWVRIADGRIEAVGNGRPDRPADVHLGSGVLVPGLVDAQVNGAFGVDLADADPDGWRSVVTRLPQVGVTAFVPTFITAPVPELAAALRRYAALRPVLDALPAAARTLGVHLEGPFLSPARRGAHRADLLTDPTAEAIDALLEAGAGGALRYVTLAPERSGADAAIRRLVAAGVAVSVGHCDASAEQVHAAAEAGARLVTHLYNGQRPLHHRDPGVVGAALADRRLTCGLIADGHHVLPDAIAVAFAAAPGRIMLVSDALSALGVPAGRYRLGGQDVLVGADGEPARRAEGTLAGAATGLDGAVGVAVAAGVPLQRAVEAATRVPADALGRPDLGRLMPGAAADLVWLDGADDARLRARATWVGGRLAHGDLPRQAGSRVSTS
jgi:N-acetylglucosamine-6-phosphate deacetylase